MLDSIALFVSGESCSSRGAPLASTPATYSVPSAGAPTADESTTGKRGNARTASASPFSGAATRAIHCRPLVAHQREGLLTIADEAGDRCIQIRLRPASVDPALAVRVEDRARRRVATRPGGHRSQQTRRLRTVAAQIAGSELRRPRRCSPPRRHAHASAAMAVTVEPLTRPHQRRHHRRSLLSFASASTAWARLTNGRSIIRPSSRKAPRPACAASCAAATMRRAVSRSSVVGAEDLVGRARPASDARSSCRRSRAGAPARPRAETLRRRDVGIRAVVREPAALGARHAHLEHRGVHVGRAAPVGVHRFEQIGQSQLQPRDARMRGGDLRQPGAGPRGVSMLTSRPIGRSTPLRRSALSSAAAAWRTSAAHCAFGRFSSATCGQANAIKSPSKCGEPSALMRTMIDLADSLHGARAQEIGDLLAGARLGVFRNGILHVKRDRVRCRRRAPWRTARGASRVRIVCCAWFSAPCRTVCAKATGGPAGRRLLQTLVLLGSRAGRR